jgi:hypothetical protein
MTRGFWLAVMIPISAQAQNRCSLSVSVVDTLEHPIQGAHVRVVQEASASRTNDRGRVVFRDLAFDEVELDVRAIGFSPKRSQVPCRTPSSTAVIHLTSSLIALDTVRVVVAPSDPTGFYARMSQSRGGYFVTDSAIQRVRPRRVSDLLLGIPGVTMRRGELGVVIELGGRGAKRIDEKPCRVVYFLDGVPFETSREGIDADISIGEIIAVEVYNVASVPAQFSPLGANCGVILLWTKASKTRH